MPGCTVPERPGVELKTMYSQQGFVKGRKLKSLKLLAGYAAVQIAGLGALISFESVYTPLVIASIIGGYVLSGRIAKKDESEITLKSPVERIAIGAAEHAAEIPEIVTIKLGPGDYFVRRQLGNRAY